MADLPREYNVNKIGHFTGISQFSATSCRPSGMAFITNLTYCPNWKRDCSYKCFGSFNNEGYTRQQTIDKAFRNIVGRSGSVLLKESFYNADKQCIDNWRTRNPTVLIFVGYPSLTHEKCYNMNAYKLPSVDSCADVSCPPKCVGDDLYRQRCVDGKCVPDLFFEKNAAACGYVPPVDDKFAEWIGAITHDVHEEPGKDEITFKIPINNNSSKTTYNYIKLYDAAGKELDKEPDVLYKSISPGDTGIITITSKWKFWSIEDVQGQTVTFKLFSSFSRLDLKQAYMKRYAVPTHEEKPEPEPDIEENPTGKIWPVVQQIHKEIGKDEITFTVPVTNTSNKTTYNYIKLFDASGKYLEKEPDILFKSIAPGATSDIILTSKWKGWNIEDVQGQTVTFKLFSSFSMWVSLVLVNTRMHSIEAYDEEPPVEPPYEPPVEPPYEPPVEPPIEPPVEPPVEPPIDEEDEDEEDGVLMYIALFAIAYIIFSSG